MLHVVICTSTEPSSTKQNPLDVLVNLSLMRRTSYTGRAVISTRAFRI